MVCGARRAAGVREDPDPGKVKIGRGAIGGEIGGWGAEWLLCACVEAGLELSLCQTHMHLYRRLRRAATQMSVF
jgi:hypothetical protein